MISCTEFIPLYSEFFKYLAKNCGGDEAVHEYWNYLADYSLGDLTNPDGSITPGAQAGEGELKIDAIRRDEVPGIHTITYDSAADSITITHDAKNRSGFALGAVIAAEYVNEHNGLLGMSNLFDF